MDDHAAAAALIDNSVSRIVQLKALEDLWRAENARDGGRYALNGFRFQLLCTLERLIRDAPTLTSTLVAESLADIVEADGRSIVATEVKSTLTSGTLDRALNQLWRVHVLAVEKVPSVAQQLMYRILYCRAGLRDPEDTFSKWHPQNPAGHDVDLFKANVVIERRVSVVNELAARLVNDYRELDPFTRVDEWLGSLIQAAETGKFLEACERIRVQALSLWIEARRVPPEFHVWACDDQPPVAVSRETVEHRQVLTGQRAHLRHLREGRFANRARYKELHRAAEEYLSALDEEHWEELQAFWVAGRSGSGKSVALLHLLAALKAEDSQRIIIWLGNEAKCLESAVQWALPMLETGAQVFIAADDPYQSGPNQLVPELLGSSLRLLQSRLTTNPGLKLPVFLFCGPPEQQEAFSEETIDDLRITSYRLLPEAADDIAELKDWYFKRTGKANLSTEDDGVLLVQLFFEWQTGEPIRAFAKRLKIRLKQMMPEREDTHSVFGLVARILAMRRLYVPYPAAAMARSFVDDPELERAFSRLAEPDQHFEVAPEHGEIRFTHPHLADAIYRAWFGGAADGPLRASHLLAGIRAWWTSAADPGVRLKALWAIEGLLAVKDQPGGRVLAPRWGLIADVANSVLETSFEEHVGSIEEPCAYYPIWARLEARLNLQLRPSALTCLSTGVKEQATKGILEVRGLPLACKTLLQLVPDESSPLLVAPRDLLSNRSDWRYWLPVALRYGHRFGFDGILRGAEQFMQDHPADAHSLFSQMFFFRKGLPSEAERGLAIDWLRLDGAQDPSRTRFHAGLISEYIEIFGLDDAIREPAKAFLRDWPSHSSWSYIWEKLWKLDPGARPVLAEEAIQWLWTCGRETKGCEFVIKRLVEDIQCHAVSSDRLTALARHRLGYLEDETWSTFWELLWKWSRNDSKGHLRALGTRWLSRPERKSWSYVWLPLWAEPDRDTEELSKLALDFLRDIAHNGWTRIWVPMWLAKADDGAALQSLAFEFLEADLLHSGWTYIWSHMWRDPGPALDRLRGLGMRFLMENPAESGWNWVFERLSTDNCRDAEQLWEIAAVRLENTRGDAKLWSYDWKQAWDTICGTSEKKKKFCVLGLAFLADDHVPETWPMIWNRLWDSGLADKQKLAERARFLLSNVTTKTREQVLKRLDGDLMPRPWNNSEDYSWSDEWVDRWKVVRTDEERGRLLEEAYRWLSQPAGGGWSKIWRYVWAGSNSAARNVSLTKLAHRWLEAKDFAHKRWPILWCELWDFPGLPERKAVAELGRRFLQTASMDDGYLEVSKRLSSRTSDLRH